MTKVTFYQNSDRQCVGFEARDHAGYAGEGEDIVCAAISALVINAVNSIEAFTDDAVTVESDADEALIRLKVEGEPSPSCQLLLNSLILGLQRMEDDEQYTQFIDIIFEEV
ncbi:MAG TPA: ribosomal-processing cysteine protease Prp [Candidatus Pullilachnospira intestinigallinarum]|nr:ribosomal-processing cysteine protease Prp [Candidatus Pullilachnospira intestinigallinarum]